MREFKSKRAYEIFCKKVTSEVAIKKYRSWIGKYLTRLAVGLQMDNKQSCDLIRMVNPNISWNVIEGLQSLCDSTKCSPVQFEAFEFLRQELSLDDYQFSYIVSGKERKYKVTLKEFMFVAKKLTSVIMGNKNKMAQIRYTYFIPAKEKRNASPSKNGPTHDAAEEYRRYCGKTPYDRHKLGHIFRMLEKYGLFRRICIKGHPNQFMIAHENPYYLLACVPDIPEVCVPVEQNPYLSSPKITPPADELLSTPQTMSLEEANNLIDEAENLRRELEIMKTRYNRLQSELIRQKSERVSVA